MSSPLGGAKDATTTGQLGVDSVDRGGNTQVPRGVHGASSTAPQSGPEIDHLGDAARRRTLADRHARLLDQFIACYASDTGKKASDESVRKVANATVSLFESDPGAQALFNPRDDRGRLARLFTSASQTRPDKLAARQHEGVNTVRDFTTALGDRADARLEHFHRAIKANPELLKTRMRYGLFLLRTRSTREQRQQMRAIAAGLLLCGFDANSVAYAMKAMRAAINKDDTSDAKLAQAYSDMQAFIKGGGAHDDSANMVAHDSGLRPVLTFLRRAGRDHVQGDLPVSLRRPRRPKAAKPEAPERSKPQRTTDRAPQNDAANFPSKAPEHESREQEKTAARNEADRLRARARQRDFRKLEKAAARNEDDNFLSRDVFVKDDLPELEKIAADVDTKKVGENPNYIEFQSRALCAKHAANAYLHGEVISAPSLNAFLKLNEFWLNPDLDALNNQEVLNPIHGTDAANLSNYLNWLNGKGLLGRDQRPLVLDPYKQADIEQLKPPQGSHMMFYQSAGAHFVAFHPRKGGKFALYDSVMSQVPHEIDPVEFAKAKISGEGGSGFNLMEHMFDVKLPANRHEGNAVVVMRPTEDGFETRGALAHTMTVDKTRDLDDPRMTLLKEFLAAATDLDKNGTRGDPVARPVVDEKDAVTDEAANGVRQAHDQPADSKLVGDLSVDFPQLRGSGASGRRDGVSGEDDAGRACGHAGRGRRGVPADRADAAVRAVEAVRAARHLS